MILPKGSSRDGYLLAELKAFQINATRKDFKVKFTVRTIENENRILFYSTVTYWSSEKIKRYLLEFQNTGHLPVHSHTLLNLSTSVYFYSVDVSVWSGRHIMTIPA